MGAWHLACLPFAVHSLAMLVDEAWFHRRRGLPRWERWGHPVDTLSVLSCYVLALAPPPYRNLWVYLAAALFSALCVTKDEWIHAKYCEGGEMWLHAFLFTMHPVLLALLGLYAFAPSPSAAIDGGRAFFGLFLKGQAVLTALFLLWQTFYWNGPWKRPEPAQA